jgi:hypothetical protein
MRSAALVRVHCIAVGMDKRRQCELSVKINGIEEQAREVSKSINNQGDAT